MHLSDHTTLNFIRELSYDNNAKLFMSINNNFIIDDDKNLHKKNKNIICWYLKNTISGFHTIEEEYAFISYVSAIVNNNILKEGLEITIEDNDVTMFRSH